MSVPPWFQWEVVVAVVAVVVVLAVVALALGAVRPGAAERAEWQAWLDTRSVRQHRDGILPAPGAGPRRTTVAQVGTDAPLDARGSRAGTGGTR